VIDFEAIRENRNNFLDPSTKKDYPVAYYENGIIPIMASTENI
jgi:hypothetical protein